MKILIADDEAGSREMLAGFLVKRGFEVFKAEDGDQALSQALAHQPNVVLLDWMMPKKTGIEVLKTLNQHMPQPPMVIMTTGKDQPNELAAMLDAGATAILTKPYDLGELLGLLQKVEQG